MGCYRGPVEKLSRREGIQLYLKGERVLAEKSAIERSAYPPGQHGRGRPRLSEQRLQLREKQKAKRVYGLRERQFRNLFGEASRSLDTTGEILLRLLELRLGNVLYRLGLASTRAQASASAATLRLPVASMRSFIALARPYRCTRVHPCRCAE